MREVVKLIFLVVALLLAVPTGAAFGSQEQEIYRIVGAGYYDIWRHSDGTWQASGKPGDKGRMTEHDYALPADKLKGFKLTRIEVTSTFGETEHAKARGRGLLSGVAWDDYEQDFLKHSPLAVCADKASEDLEAGGVSVKWTLDLHPVRPREQQREALDLKANAHVLEDRYKSSVGFAQAVEGWRWYLPVMIIWYGIPEAVPDFWVKLIPDRFETELGQIIEGIARFGLNEDHHQPEEAWLRLDHVVNGTYYPAVLEPLDPADMLDADGRIMFDPGEVKEYRFRLNVQVGSEMAVGRINPISTDKDRDWSNNRAEAPIILPATCTDISVKLTRAQGGKRLVGDNTQLVATVTRAKDGPEGPVNVRFRFGHGSWREFTLNQGQSRTFNDVVRHDRAGSITYAAEAWPVGIEDCNPANNRAAVTIRVEQYIAPPDEEDDLHPGVTSRR